MLERGFCARCGKRAREDFAVETDENPDSGSTDNIQ